VSVIDVRDVSIRFGAGSRAFLALDGISVSVEQGEFLTLIGHSGCGKSTLLNLIAGLHRPSGGCILFDGRTIEGPGPDRAVVFQNHSLLPWMTCFENVMLGVRQVFGRRLRPAELAAKVDAALELVHLEHASSKYPYEISGGMKQRVASRVRSRSNRACFCLTSPSARSTRSLGRACKTS
jgi:nitrate/nitrite transport system ATP-binding protein